MREYGEIVKLISSFLNKNKVPFVFVGAISVAAWGSPRTSNDIDIIIMLEKNIEKFVNFLRKNNFSTHIDEVKKALKEKSHFIVYDNLSIFRLDIKGVYTELDKSSLEKRKKVSLYGQNIWVSPPEDLLLIKLSFASEQDLNDARSILIRQKELDMNYLFKEAKKLGVYNKLIELINETKHIRKT